MSETLPAPEPQVFNPQALSELFAKDPETLTDEEVAVIVAELRAQRRTWVMEDQKAKLNNEHTPHKAIASGKKEKQKVSLSDLQLEI